MKQNMEWKTPETKRPKKGEEVLVILKDGQMRTAIADNTYWSGFKYMLAENVWFSIAVTYWAEKPKSPT